MSATLRILEMPVRPDARLIGEFAKSVTAHLSDSMERLYAAGAELRPMHAGGRLAGPAFTVKTAPGDNLLVHKAIDMARPGDVIVVDAGGSLTNALMGEMMLMQITKRGVAGVVINGAIRDAGYIREQKLPVFSAGVTHRGPYKNGPGEINVPVAIDGMVIEPGDLVLGDDDGVLCVPFDQVEEVFKAATAKYDAEQKQIANIQAGTHDASWVDKQLREMKCEGVG